MNQEFKFDDFAEKKKKPENPNKGIEINDKM
jgi:hypothetical protein